MGMKPNLQRPPDWWICSSLRRGSKCLTWGYHPVMNAAEQTTDFRPYDVYNVRRAGFFYLVEMCQVRNREKFGTWSTVARHVTYAPAIKLAAALTIMNLIPNRGGGYEEQMGMTNAR